MAINTDLIYGSYNIRSIVGMPNGPTKEAGWGTTFGLNFGQVTVMPTARHVLDPKFKDPSYVGATAYEVEIRGRHLFDGGAPTGNFATTFDRFGICWPADNVSDVAVLYGFKSRKDKPIINIHAYAPPYLPDLATLMALPVGAPVGAPGYPEHHDQIDLRPLFRTGHVASDPRYDYAVPRYNDKQGHYGRIVAYDGFSYGGLSGAPVLWHHDDLRQPYIVGVNVGHLDTHTEGLLRGHSGLSYFYRFDILAERLNGLFRGLGWHLPCPSYAVSETIMTQQVGGPSPMPLQEVSTAAVDKPLP